MIIETHQITFDNTSGDTQTLALKNNYTSLFMFAASASKNVKVFLEGSAGSSIGDLQTFKISATPAVGEVITVDVNIIST